MDKQSLIQIIRDQANEPMPEVVIPRGKYQEVLQLVDNKQVIILSGVRRCGKSTIMKIVQAHLSQSDYYINFDDDRLVPFKLAHFQLLIDAFIELYGVQNTFFFDEIQNIEGWEHFVRRLHNEGKKVFVTGSNASLLSSELGTHLTGRHITVKIYPYSFREYVTYVDPHILNNEKSLNSTQLALLKKYFSEFKIYGGFPEFLEKKQNQYLNSLYESILYRDIIVRHKLPQERPIKELVYFLASNNTKEFTYNSLCKLIGVGSSNTVSEYCHYLESSFLCFTLNRFSYSLKKQSHYAKKIYFIDQALAQSVGFRISGDFGRVLENIVFLGLLSQGLEVYFHKDKYECDFVIRDGYNIVKAIQVSTSLTDPNTHKREINGLMEAMTAYNLSEGLIITDDQDSMMTVEQHNKSYQIKIIPAWKWLLESTSYTANPS